MIGLTVEKLGLVSKSNLPRAPQYLVLRHLNSVGEPRLYVQEAGGRVRASLTNSEDAAGWAVRCAVDRLHFMGWIVLDQPQTRKHRGTIRVYKISARGKEAVAQYRAHLRFTKEVKAAISRLLAEERALVANNNRTPAND